MLLAEEILLPGFHQHRFQQSLADLGTNKTFPVLGKHRYVPHRIVHLKATEPTEKQTEIQLFHHPTLARNPMKHLQQKSPQKLLRSNRWTSGARIHRTQLRIDPFQRTVHQNSDRTQRMVHSNTLLQSHVTEHRRLNRSISTHTYFLASLPGIEH